MEKKKCFRCGKTKSLDQFYVHKQMADGHFNKCKDCTKVDVKNREDVLRTNPEWVEKERKRGREKFHRLGYAGVADKKSNDRYFEKYPEKQKAKNRSSRIKISEGMERHHWSYNDEHFKDIIELTKKDHMKSHRFISYDQERKMYRDLNGILLDTKERHLKYILDKIKNEED